MKTLVLLCVLVALCAGVAAWNDTEYDGPPYPGNGHHPPGVGHHPLDVGRHSPAWSKWRAYRALQAWKKAITEDPKGVTRTWVGPNVCGYTGVFCSPPEDPELSYLEVVAGIDLNGANLKGCLVPELGLLREIGLFHLNSNRFFGEVPDTFKYLVTLFELDLSNNKLSGTFPEVVLEIRNLVFLDIRFNNFYGKLPRELFSKPLDAIFVNDNNFDGELPETFGLSNSSAIVLANNQLQGSIPKSISKLNETLNEIVALNNKFHGKLPSTLGHVSNVYLFDFSINRIGGGLPSSIRDLAALETFNMANNRLSGKVKAGLCSLRNLTSVVLDYNFFNAEDPTCTRLGSIISLKGNCLPGAPDQKSSATCAAFYGPPPPPPPPPCPQGYKRGRHSKKCFKLIKDWKTWDEAEFKCQHDGGHLAPVAHWKELEDLGDLCSKVNETLNATANDPRGPGCYLGGTKPKVIPPSQGWFYPWYPCVKFNQSFWNYGEPDDEGHCETCLTIKYGPEEQAQTPGKLPYMLNDAPCDLRLPFICALKRCDHVGCDLDHTCKTDGDKKAKCSTDRSRAVGYKCSCSKNYTEDKAGTCVWKVDP